MMNKVILIGRMGKDPELKTFASGGALANLRVITNQVWKDRQTGGFKERTDGHNVVVHQAEAAKRLSNTLKKGDLVQIEGSLENRQWVDQEGRTRWVTEIVVRGGGGTVKRLGTRAVQNTDATSHAGHNPEQPASTEAEDTPSAADGGHVEIDFFDDGFGEGFGDA